MNLEGQQLGEFEILERLGQGGMGAVYKARQKSLRRVVALKTLQAGLADDADYIARFEQEAVAAAGLNHPNLVQVHSAGENDGLHWFAMEYVDGESARARLKRKGRLDPLEAIAIAIHVATALEYGWRKAQLIHRDIKPDNIFLSSDGEVKLGDLGLAKSAGQNVGLTTTGHSMGTPHYISPEQVQSTRDVDLRADIYSLGCTLYHFLSGQAPFEGNSAVAIMVKHINEPVPILKEAWPECPQVLNDVVGKMMQKDATDRQQNYAEVITDLRRVSAASSGAGLPNRGIAKGQPVTNQRAVPRAATVIAAVVACIGLGALLYFARWKKSGQYPEPERHEKKLAAQNGSPGTIPTDEKTAAIAAEGKALAVATIPAPKATPTPTTPTPTVSTSVRATPASTRAPSTPSPSATPKPMSEVENWLAQVDGSQQEVFKRQVLKPFEDGAADLRARYLAALDAAVAKASAGGQLADALVWRTERQAFEKAQNVAANDADTPAGVKTLRAFFRQQLTKLDQDRTIKAKALFTQYDAVLAKNETLLTQHQRLDDALLLKNKRDEIALTWLGSPQSATRNKPFENSLGMKFVPVPITGRPTDGQRVLFSIWDTRMQDYEVFAEETTRDWPEANFPQGPAHPAVMVSWEDAQAFCQWLTERERKTGKLGVNEVYRLPSDHEWSCAVGIGEREARAQLPEDKSGNIKGAFPWGDQWPPPKGVGNYSASFQVDDFDNTSPVGSFEANRFGLYDMGGNIFQWCEDWYGEDRKDRVLRGGSWVSGNRDYLLSSFRYPLSPGLRFDYCGFRCVLELPQN